MSGARLVVHFLLCTITLVGSLSVRGQVTTESGPGRQLQEGPEAEFRLGTQLTRQARYQEAIPHFLAARGRVLNTYALDFNLALCYVGSGQPAKAIDLLQSLRRQRDNANVEDLLAQAYIANGDSKQAMAALERAATATPKDEKLYVRVADACMEQENYEMGLRVAALGLQHLPQSARLLYQRAMFFTLLDQFDEARADFDQSARLAPDRAIGFIAAAHKELFAGNVMAAIKAARTGIRKNIEDYLLYALLGEALLRSGISPGQPEFAEAQTALEKAVNLRPAYADAQLALGKLHLLAGRLDQAIFRLEAAKQLAPRNPAVYSNLAAAYRRRGDERRAAAMVAELARFNEEQAARIRAATGERKAAYAARSPR